MSFFFQFTFFRNFTFQVQLLQVRAFSIIFPQCNCLMPKMQKTKYESGYRPLDWTDYKFRVYATVMGPKKQD